MAELTYIKLFMSYAEQLELLSDAERGRVVSALFKFSAAGEVSQLSPIENMCFSFITSQIKRDVEDYDKVCERNTKIANKRWAKKHDTTEYHEVPESTCVYQETNSYPENAKEKEKEKDKDKDKIKDKDKKGSLALFEQFWTAYPKKTAKQNAIKAFTALGADDLMLQTILSALECQKNSSQWQENDGQFIPYPATWLNNRRFEDVSTAFISSDTLCCATQVSPAPTKEEMDAIYNSKIEITSDQVEKMSAKELFL